MWFAAENCSLREEVRTLRTLESVKSAQKASSQNAAELEQAFRELLLSEEAAEAAEGARVCFIKFLKYFSWVLNLKLGGRFSFLGFGNYFTAVKFYCFYDNDDSVDSFLNIL